MLVLRTLFTNILFSPKVSNSNWSQPSGDHGVLLTTACVQTSSISSLMNAELISLP